MRFPRQSTHPLDTTPPPHDTLDTVVSELLTEQASQQHRSTDLTSGVFGALFGRTTVSVVSNYAMALLLSVWGCK
ncbi:uncharacterized protein HVO_C0088 (plasmid) [Haloferax volcanii DS2]|uniref:Uncharacterized protein n=1 Tax=Haloferax volcanii (strain ATCC 29605 / DSM 3757 / JCM 8879 / NBRC 14742 / NCIMB 2012 / VKM B-1768 / DS2) TaxID=309800 RepID=D4H0G8_HALVD|nr:uncharacterized protein HVO_C0088 [Haloferax volcanii DS2]